MPGKRYHQNIFASLSHKWKKKKSCWNLVHQSCEISFVHVKETELADQTNPDLFKNGSSLSQWNNESFRMKSFIGRKRRSSQFRSSRDEMNANQSGRCSYTFPPERSLIPIWAHTQLWMEHTCLQRAAAFLKRCQLAKPLCQTLHASVAKTDN